MLEVDQAIMTRFNSLPHNTFYNDISGRLYNTQAPQTATFPFAVFTTVSDMNEYTFTTDFDNLLIQFSLFSDIESISEVKDMFTDCKDLFDWCQLTVSGYTHLYMRRELARLTKDDRGIWMRTIDYRIMVEAD